MIKDEKVMPGIKKKSNVQKVAILILLVKNNNKKKIKIEEERYNKGLGNLIQNSESPQKNVLNLIKKASIGGLEKYPHSNFWAHPQYCASSKCRGISSL